jgi:hypothetical protein
MSTLKMLKNPKKCKEFQKNPKKSKEIPLFPIPPFSPLLLYWQGVKGIFLPLNTC